MTLKTVICSLNFVQNSGNPNIIGGNEEDCAMWFFWPPGHLHCSCMSIRRANLGFILVTNFWKEVELQNVWFLSPRSKDKLSFGSGSEKMASFHSLEARRMCLTLTYFKISWRIWNEQWHMNYHIHFMSTLSQVN